MKNMIINKVFLCQLNRDLAVIPYTEYIPGMEDEISRYLLQLIKKYFNHETSERSYIAQESQLLQILPENSEQLEAFVNCICDTIQVTMEEYRDIPNGIALFMWLNIEDERYIAFFKMPLQTRLTLNTEEKISLIQNHVVLPGPTPKALEYFYINIENNQVQISDCKYFKSGIPVNVLGENVLGLSFKPSEAVTVKAIDQAVVETIKNYYEENIPQKIMEYKTIVADQVKEKGQIDVQKLEAEVFNDNEQAAIVYQEVIEQSDISQLPIQISKKTERKINKKQKLVTDTGIEILVPLDILKDHTLFEYQEHHDGTKSIVIKDIISIENK